MTEPDKRVWEIGLPKIDGSQYSLYTVGDAQIEPPLITMVINKRLGEADRARVAQLVDEITTIVLGATADMRSDKATPYGGAGGT